MKDILILHMYEGHMDKAKGGGYEGGSQGWMGQWVMVG